jgi:hypothetical protein
MRSCVTYMRRADANGAAPTAERRIMNAVAACKAQRRNSPDVFRRTFGTNTSSSNALGKCVRSRAKLSTRRVGR